MIMRHRTRLSREPVIACSVTFAQDVRTNYMAGRNFSKYHTSILIAMLWAKPLARADRKI
jgi:hypothetical protein